MINNNVISDFQIKEMIRLINKNFEVENCLANNRLRPNVYARHAASYYLNRVKLLTYHKCGKIINKDHASIVHSVRTHLDLYRFDKEYKQRYDAFLEEMKPVKFKRWLCVETPFNLQIIKK